MQQEEQKTGRLSPVTQRGLAIYQDKLRTTLEPERNGQAVAIHVDSENFAVARTHTAARRALLAHHAPDGRIVTLTIGPPTPTDFDMAYRMLAGQKR